MSKSENTPKRVDASGKPICGAKTKRGKGICTRPPMPNGRCYHHGGVSPPPGPSHPSWKDGRRSKYLPPAVAKRVEEALADPELLEIKENVALVSARKSMVAERLSTGESGEAWKVLKELWGEFELGNRMNQEAGDNADLRAVAREKIAKALDGIKRLINSGSSDETRWDELLTLNYAEAGLKQSETARLQRMQQMMTADQVLVILMQIRDAVFSVVTNNAQRQEIGRLLLAIMNDGVAPPARVVDAPAVVESAAPPLAEAEEHVDEKARPVGGTATSQAGGANGEAAGDVGSLAGDG